MNVSRTRDTVFVESRKNLHRPNWKYIKKLPRGKKKVSLPVVWLNIKTFWNVISALMYLLQFIMLPYFVCAEARDRDNNSSAVVTIFLEMRSCIRPYFCPKVTS